MAQTNCYGGVDKSFSGASPVINRMTTHHGRIEMISFLMVLIRVTNKDFSITSPTTSPFLVPNFKQAHVRQYQTGNNIQ
jgi:hypothetical protein